MPKQQQSEYNGPMRPIEREYHDISSIVDHAKEANEQKEFDFSSAKNLSELYQMIKEKGIITNSSGIEHTAEEIIRFIEEGALGYITNRENLRDTIKRLFSDFNSAEKLKDIYAILKYRNTIKGSQKEYTADEIIELIKEGKIKSIPRTDNLRSRVIELETRH